MRNNNLLALRAQKNENGTPHKIPGGIARFTFQERFELLWASEEFFHMMGFAREACTASFADAFGMGVGPQEVAEIKALFQNFDPQEPTFRLTYRYRAPDGSVKRIFMQAEWEYGACGEVVFSGLFIDITDAKQAEPRNSAGKEAYRIVRCMAEELEHFKEQSRRDPLTSFYNKVVIEEAIDTYFQQERRRGKCALMVIDIDNFKLINDTQGHLFGDAVLVDFADAMKHLFRTTDLIGRIGGDEFVVLMKDVRSIADIEEKSQEICNAVRSFCETGKNQNGISCSIGISLYPDHGKTYRALFKKADQALYTTKGFNKDGFTIYGTEHKQKKRPIASTNCLAHEGRRRKKLSLIRIFELLFDTKDIEHGIQMVIDLIGNHYELDRVYILEYTEDALCVYVTHEWCQSGVTPRKNQRMDRACCNRTQEYAFFCENADNAALAPEMKREMERGGVKAAMQYPLHENGKFNGTIVFEDCRSARKWSEEETEALLVISKFIASYLVKMHAQNEIEKLAYTDPLTGMWNLNKFKLSAEEMLRSLHDDAGKCYALICFDIKKFRYINDTFGFDVGDEILLYIANRLKEVLTRDMIFARMSADKFLVLTAYAEVERLIQSLNLTMKRSQYYVSAKTGRYKLIFNCGIYLIDRGNVASIPSMIDKADIARSKAHCGHENSCVFYNENFRQKLMKEKELEDMVDHALENQEFVVYYQPKVDLLDGSTQGAEALVRWVSPRKGFMSPTEFIPLFEKNGFIAKLDFYVFERVFSDLRRWIDEKKTIVPISVNLSRVHLSDGTFIEKLLTLSKKYDISPNLIEIELTESVFTADIACIIGIMHQLKELGFWISIDDFGSGYSSLRLLRDIPVDYLKLDKEFLDNGDGNIREQVILMNVIRMAKTLGIKVVSEGVETSSQAAFLKSCACDLAQGFLYARPMPVEQFENRMKYLDGRDR